MINELKVLINLTIKAILIKRFLKQRVVREITRIKELINLK